MNKADAAWRLVDFSEIPPAPCPCGETRRAFTDMANAAVSVHRVEIRERAARHYHKRLTEVYYILECGADAAMELDDERVSVKPGDCILIPPGVRHRAVGTMTLLNFVSPKFDPDDEWFD